MSGKSFISSGSGASPKSIDKSGKTSVTSGTSAIARGDSGKYFSMKRRDIATSVRYFVETFVT